MAFDNIAQNHHRKTGRYDKRYINDGKITDIEGKMEGEAKKGQARVGTELRSSGTCVGDRQPKTDYQCFIVLFSYFLFCYEASGEKIRF